jgi:hypothetical protein
MNSRNRNLVLPILIVLTAIFPGNTVAGPMSSQRQWPVSLPTHVWYDGEEERKLWIDSDLLAEFEPAIHGRDKQSTTSAVISAYPDALSVPVKYGALKLWRLGSAVNSQSAALQLKRTHPSNRYSPVMHDGPGAAGRMRALPGNIIVYLRPEWDGNAVNAWIGRHKFTVIRKLENGPNIYIIKTNPGIEALTIANTLYKSGEVVAAFPDWWEEISAQ